MQGLDWLLLRSLCYLFSFRLLWHIHLHTNLTVGEIAFQNILWLSASEMKPYSIWTIFMYAHHHVAIILHRARSRQLLSKIPFFLLEKWRIKGVLPWGHWHLNATAEVCRLISRPYYIFLESNMHDNWWVYAIKGRAQKPLLLTCCISSIQTVKQGEQRSKRTGGDILFSPFIRRNRKHPFISWIKKSLSIRLQMGR